MSTARRGPGGWYDNVDLRDSSAQLSRPDGILKAIALDIWKAIPCTLICILAGKLETQSIHLNA